MRLPRLLPLLLVFATALPLLRAEGPTVPGGPLPLTDEEIRIRLTREETKSWADVERLRENAGRDLRRGQDLQKPPHVQLIGHADESPDARRARGDALVGDATKRLSDLDAKIDVIRATVSARMRAVARRAPCPAVLLTEVFRKSAAEITAAAKQAGYEHLAVAGVFTTNGETIAADPGFTSAFLSAFAPDENTKPELSIDRAPSLSGAKLLTASPKTAVVVGEMHAMRGFAGLDGILWTARITDPDTLAVKHVTLAYVPSGETSYGTAVAYDVLLLDRRDFFGRLGPAEDWSFGLEGCGIAQALLRATLVSAEKPTLNDRAFFATTGRVTTPDTLSKAIWSTTIKDGHILVMSRQAGSPVSGAVRMGEVTFTPAVAEVK